MTAAAEGERADSWHACRKAGQVTLAESSYSRYSRCSCLLTLHR